MHGTAPTAADLIARDRSAATATAARRAHHGTRLRNGRLTRFTVRRFGDQIDN